MTENKRNVLFTTEIGEPVPGEDAFNSYNDILTIWSDGLEKDVRIGLDIPVKNDLPFLVEDTKVHCSGVQVDTTVKFVLIGVKSHLRPPCEKDFGP